MDLLLLNQSAKLEFHCIKLAAAYPVVTKSKYLRTLVRIAGLFFVRFRQNSGSKKTQVSPKTQVENVPKLRFSGIQITHANIQDKKMHFGFLAIKLRWLFTKLMVFTEKLRV